MGKSKLPKIPRKGTACGFECASAELLIRATRYDVLVTLQICSGIPLA